MIYFIVGSQNSGKTSFLKNKFSFIGDGFYSEKVYLNNSFIGYDLVRFKTQKRYIWMRLSKVNELDKKFARFFYSSKTLHEVGNILLSFKQNNIAPIYFDEIGPLELEGNGFDQYIFDLLKTCNDLYFVTRDTYLDKVLFKYNIQEYEVIHV